MPLSLRGIVIQTDLINAAITGFLISGGLIVAIGPQNAFVLRQGLLRQYVLPIVLFCSVSDAVLIIAGVSGLGALVSAYHVLATVIGVGGAIFLFFYGLKSFRRALKSEVLGLNDRTVPSLRRALLICAAFTWGNPHVYLDTLLLMGSLSLGFQGAGLIAYTIGAALASFVWFTALGFGARLLIPLFQRPLTWRLLDIGIGIVMWLIAESLIARYKLIMFL